MKFKIIGTFFLITLFMGCSSLQAGAKGHFVSALSFASNGTDYYAAPLQIDAVLELCQGDTCTPVGNITGDVSSNGGIYKDLGQYDFAAGVYQLKFHSSSSGGGSSSATEDIILDTVTILPSETVVSDVALEESTDASTGESVLSEIIATIVETNTITETSVTVDGESYEAIEIHDGTLQSRTQTILSGNDEEETLPLPLAEKDSILIDIKDEDTLSTAILITSDGQVDTYVASGSAQDAVAEIIQQISGDTSIPVDELVEQTDITLIDDSIEADIHAVSVDEQNIVERIQNTAESASEQAVLADKEQLLIDIELEQTLINADTSLSSSAQLELNTGLERIAADISSPEVIEQNILELHATIQAEAATSSDPLAEEALLEQETEAIYQDLEQIASDEETATIDATLLQEAEAQLAADLEQLQADEEKIATIINADLHTSIEIKGTETELLSEETLVSEEIAVIEADIQAGNVVQLSVSTDVSTSTSESTSVDTGSSTSSSSVDTSVSVGL